MIFLRKVGEKRHQHRSKGKEPSLYKRTRDLPSIIPGGKPDGIKTGAPWAKRKKGDKETTGPAFEQGG